jgi:thioredoxin reductase (NADPH)
MYDCLIVGGGPAGLSAAIYMGRFLRSVAVLDEGGGRSSFGQVNDNYLGFPEGISVSELRERGRKQAERFGAHFEDCTVHSIARDGPNFVAHTSNGEFQGRTVILCTGVCDIWPDIPDVLEYVGKSLFWCITCDGFRTLGKRMVIFGAKDDAAVTACQFLAYTKDITFITSPGRLDCTDENVRNLEEQGIRMMEGDVAEVLGAPEEIEAVRLKDGRVVEADIMFSYLGVLPNNRLALDLGVHCHRDGYIIVDEEGYTSVRGVFAAGDLSRMHTHQVIAAAHEGAEAAQTANYYLYADYQKNE